MLSPIKQSNRKRAKPTTYFDMDIQMDSTTKGQAACFCKDRYSIFQELNSSSSTGCTLKFFSQLYEDISINDKIAIQRKSLNFEKSSEIKISDIKTIINEYRLFEKVDIKAFVTEVSPKTTEITTIEKTSVKDIDLDSRQCGNKQTVKCKIVSVDLDTLREKILCSKCKSNT